MLFNLLAESGSIAESGEEAAAETVTSVQGVLNKIADWGMTVGIKIVFALILCVIGFAVINMFVGWIKKINIKRGFDKTLGVTLRKVISVGLKILLIMALLGYVGIDISGVAALVTSLGVTIGLALQGALANVAGGVLIVTLRPFRLDDFIEAQGIKGTVEDIRLVYTYVRTMDNKVVALPNGTLANGTIINYSAKTSRRVDIRFNVSYDTDFKKAQEIVLDVAAKHKLIFNDPAPLCRIDAHNDSSIELFSTFWCKTEDYWTVYFDMFEQVKTAFDENGITIPFNQLDVHITGDKALIGNDKKD